MGPTLDEPQSFGQGSYFGRSWEYGGLYGIRSRRRYDWNYSKPELRHGQSLGLIQSELLVETDLKDVYIISFHGRNLSKSVGAFRFFHISLEALDIRQS